MIGSGRRNHLAKLRGMTPVKAPKTNRNYVSLRCLILPACPGKPIFSFLFTHLWLTSPYHKYRTTRQQKFTLWSITGRARNNIQAALEIIPLQLSVSLSIYIIHLVCPVCPACSVCPFVRLSVRPSVRASVCLSLCVSVSLSDQCRYLSIHLTCRANYFFFLATSSTQLSVFLISYLLIFPCIYLSIFLHYLFIWTIYLYMSDLA